MSEAPLLDASALIALLRAEPGAERVADVLPAARICAVNLAEVLSQLVRRGAALEDAVRRIESLRLPVVPFDHTLAALAASLHAASRAAGLSLGDCCCLACGLAHGLPVMTTDRAWAKLDLGVKVLVIRQAG